MNQSHRLLILSCSNRKRADAGLLPAIQRYNGPCFQVLRRYLQDNSTDGQAPDVLIISAEYGLIWAKSLIANYDRRLTRARAIALQPKVLTELRHILDDDCPYGQLFICMGKDYQRILDRFEAWVTPGVIVQVVQGSPGVMQAQLFDWLYGEPPVSPSHRSQIGSRLHGIDIKFPPDQILELARQALANDSTQAGNYRAWYVEIDGQRVAPKWLVSQLTGLPVRNFHTHRANQIIAQLGIRVHRDTAPTHWRHYE